MTDELFPSIPASESPSAKLAAARRRYEEAKLAVDGAERATDEIGLNIGPATRELMAARNDLEQAERAAYADARGVPRRRIDD
jgi:hypothetical protein